MTNIAKSLLPILFLLLLLSGTSFLAQAQNSQLSTVQDAPKASVSPKQITAPQYPGGEKELLKLLAMNARYPSQAQLTKKAGRVIMQVTIDEEGKVRNIKAAHTDNPLFEKEGMRVLKLMAKWVPAKINGAPVSSTYLFPFTFKIKGADENELASPQDKVKEVSDKISVDAPDQPVYLAEEVVIVGYGVVRKGGL